MAEKVERKTYYIRLGGRLFPVSKEVYQAYYAYERHLRILQEKDLRNGWVSYSALDTSETLGEELFPDRNSPPVEEAALQTLLWEQLRQAIARLTAPEQALYKGGLSEREYAAQIGLPQQTIHDRKARILEKLTTICKQ